MTDAIGGWPPTPADLEAAAAAAVEEGWGRPPSRVRRVSSDLEETFLVAFHTPPAHRAVLKIAEPRRDPEWFAFEAAIVEQALRGAATRPTRGTAQVCDQARPRGCRCSHGRSIRVTHGSTR